MPEEERTSTPELVDPDPFAIGFALLSLLVSGGAYLELRRNRILTENQRTGEFRQTWFQARRTLIHARRVVEEFATYVAEDGYGRQQFLFGRARMNLPRERVDQLRRLHANALTTASYMADNLDALSEFLDSSYQAMVDQIMHKLEELEWPHTYDAVVILAREGVSLYEDLIQAIDADESFS